MQLISATDLRRNTKKLFDALEKGKTVNLIKGSRVVAEIKPKKAEAKALTKTGVKELKKIAKELSLPKLSYKEREKRYREAMEKKHGKHIP